MNSEERAKIIQTCFAALWPNITPRIWDYQTSSIGGNPAGSFPEVTVWPDGKTRIQFIHARTPHTVIRDNSGSAIAATKDIGL